MNFIRKNIVSGVVFLMNLALVAASFLFIKKSDESKHALEEVAGDNVPVSDQAVVDSQEKSDSVSEQVEKNDPAEPSVSEPVSDPTSSSVSAPAPTAVPAPKKSSSKTKTS